jgi:integrase
MSAEADQPFVASPIPGRAVKTFSRHTLRKRFRTACRVLGAARLETLTIHHGRHAFISHALARGRSLPVATMRKIQARALTTAYNPGAVRVRDDREFRTKLTQMDGVRSGGQYRAAESDRESVAGGKTETPCDDWH